MVLLVVKFAIYTLLILINIHRCTSLEYEKNYFAEAKIRKLLASLTLQEKIQLMHGRVSRYTGRMQGVKRLDIPDLLLNDGPQGFRGFAHRSMAWPSGLSLAASFDEKLVYDFAVELGKEFKEKGANVILGPALCVERIPQNGRNFEYLSGESPTLGARLAAAYVKGAQSNKGIIATAKHYILNSQETDRTTSSSIVDEYVLRELYLPPFQSAIKAGVLAIMCSYNKINGTYACENNSTLGRILREDLGFKGFVMSDWFATHSTIHSVDHGLDQEMPYGLHYGSLLESNVRKGHVPLSKIDGHVSHILHSIKTANVTDSHCFMCLHRNTVTTTRIKLARRIASESIVLLKNENILPLRKEDFAEKEDLLVIGEAASSPKYATGGGSGGVTSRRIVSVLDGIKEYLISLHGHARSVIYDEGSNISKAIQLSRNFRKIIIVVGSLSGEGSDRSSLSFGAHQDELVKSLSKNKNLRTVVIAISPGPMLVPWSDDTGALLATFMPGQEMGNAVAQVLFGEINPSGKLPFTVPNKDNEMNLSKHQFPGVMRRVKYSEGLIVGYRWYEHFNIKPKFPFGHGISYTSFRYAALACFGNYCSFTIQNIGSVSGAEVLQVYIDRSCLSTSDEIRPEKELVYFKKLSLIPKQIELIRLTVPKSAIAYWNAESGTFKKDLNKPYRIFIGSSIRDIRLSATIRFANSERVTS